ncbi:uncharacterized protein LOC141899386 isoform X4 [Tubulanus polymorphus]|uniref:uncharacterized protein LOC141899386 isoform X4 n=1 Tax=Tubulanus polymorphus TaxID=672921 RepID=UPI003DA6BBDE
MNRSSHHMERPRSELLVDLHVYIVPRELWVDRLHCALNQVIEETVSAGFVRVLPETRVHDLREDIEKQLGYEVVPKNYVFLKSVGRCLTRVKAKQEYQMKIKHFLPPHAYCPEIFLLDPPATMRGMSSTDDDSLRNSITPYNKSKEPEPKPVRAKSQTPRPVEPERDEIGSSSSAELRTPHLLENSDTNDDDNFINNNKNNDDNGTRSGSPASARRQTASGTPMSATPCGSRTSFYFDLLTRKIPTADTSSRRAKYSQETKDSGIAEDSYSDRQRQLDRRKPEKIQQKKPKPRVHIAPPPKPAESPKPPSRQSTPPAPSQQRQRTLTPYKPDPTDEDRWAEHSDDAEPQEEPEEEADEELEEEEDDFDELEGEGRDSENRRKLEEERRRREEERRRREEERRRQKEEDDRRRRQELEDEERRRRQEQEDWENVQRQEEDDRRRREELERKRREEEDERRLKEEKERRLREEEERKKAAAKNKDDERRQLMEELEQIQKDRKEMEAKREELVRRAKLLQSKTQTKRNQARDVWKKKYFEEKKKTPALEDKCNKLRIELESLHRKIVGQMETGPVKEKHSIKPVEKGGKPSQAANLRIQATKLQHEVEEMQRRVDDSKMKLTAEVKLRNQAESELRALRAELTQKKINLTLTRSQKLAALGSTSDLQQQPLTARQSIAITPKS